MRFRDRVVIVTGGAAGIGRAASLAFAREGAAVAVVDLKGAEGVVVEVGQAGGRATAFATDVARAADVQAMLDGVVARFGRIDVLVADVTAANGYLHVVSDVLTGT